MYLLAHSTESSSSRSSREASSGAPRKVQGFWALLLLLQVQ